MNLKWVKRGGKHTAKSGDYTLVVSEDPRSNGCVYSLLKNNRVQCGGGVTGLDRAKQEAINDLTRFQSEKQL